jgi:ferrous iron transport protein B
MTIMLTPFIPCGAKIPVFAMFSALLFANAAWVGPSMYLLGIAMVIVSGLILKQTKLFSGEASPFVMELPSYHLPHMHGVAIHMWEKGKSFIIKAGTVIFLASGIIWFLQSFSSDLQFLAGEHIEQSILAGLGKLIAPLLSPMGFGNWMAAVATMTGLVARELVVATFNIIGTTTSVIFTQVSAYAFMIFVLLSAPCFAAIAAMRREFGSWKWTFIALGYQTGLAYVLATLVNLIGSLVLKNTTAVTPVVMDTTLMHAATESGANGKLVMLTMVNYIVIGLIIVGVFFAARHLIRAKKNGGGCAAGCSGCSGSQKRSCGH